MISNRLALLSCFAFLAFGTGCRCTDTCVELPFPGLKADLAQTISNHATLRLMIVHGMSNHTQGYSSNFVDTIARKLKLNQISSEVEVLTGKGGLTNGFLRKVDLGRGETNLISAYELTWSPATFSEKVKRFEYDARLDGKRASLNRQLKSGLLNDGFADAILYLNDDFRPRIQEPVTNAIWKILDGDFKTNDLFVIVTHSLGSKITFDSLNIISDEMVERKSPQAVGLTNLAAGLSHLVMLANQVPLLRLGETNVLADRKPEEKPSAVQKFLNTRRKALQQRARAGQQKPEVKVIAVTDPNDLLSYPLRREDLITDTSSDIKFGNLFICNAPAFLHWIANPVKAHEGYFDNPRLVDLLIKGNSKPEKICLKEAPLKNKSE